MNWGDRHTVGRGREISDYVSGDEYEEMHDLRHWLAENLWSYRTIQRRMDMATTRSRDSYRKRYQGYQAMHAHLVYIHARLPGELDEHIHYVRRQHQVIRQKYHEIAGRLLLGDAYTPGNDDDDDD